MVTPPIKLRRERGLKEGFAWFINILGARVYFLLLTLPAMTKKMKKVLTLGLRTVL